MKRTDAEGHDSNRYSEGNPSLGIPATVVGAEEMNNLQEELANIVDAAGITLDAGDEDQVLEALATLLEAGFPNATKGSQTLLNNQSSAVNITGLVFDKTNVKSARFLIDCHRETDTGSEQVDEQFELVAMYDPVNDSWSIHWNSIGPDDSYVTFAISSAGQVQYLSSNFSGANYDGTLRFGHVRTLAI